MVSEEKNVRHYFLSDPRMLLSYVRAVQECCTKLSQRNNENCVIIKLPLIKHRPHFVTHLDLEKVLVV
jgi:hypothetical protein